LHVEFEFHGFVRFKLSSNITRVHGNSLAGKEALEVRSQNSECFSWCVFTLGQQFAEVGTNS
jgi:hypothetical protein